MKLMAKRKPTSERVHRKLTTAEQRQLDDARQAEAAMKDEILAEGRKYKQAWITA